MKRTILSIYVCTLLSAISLCANAQQKGCYVIKNNYSITIAGSSNLHDWSETVQRTSGCGVIQNVKGVIDVDSLFIRMDVRSISSSEGKTMVNKTLDALKADHYPYITFTVNAPLKITASDKNGTLVSTAGELTIAGVTRRVNVTGKIYADNPGQFIFEGTFPVKMSDYNIVPPTAMLGLLKVKNQINVTYRTCFEMKG